MKNSTRRSTRRSRDKWNRMLVVDTTAFIQPQPDEPSQQEQKNEVDESSVQEQDDDDVPQQKKQKNEASESLVHDNDVEELPTAKKDNGLQQLVDKIFTTAAEKKKKKLRWKWMRMMMI